MKQIGRWSKEPLLHFIVLGALLLGLHRWLAQPPAHRIVLSASTISGLRQDHLRRTGMLPTADEEQALIQQFVDTEVMYREALALGLDRGDIIVRRRLVQKMEFLTEGLAPLSEPSDSELQAFLDAHPARYAQPARVTLSQVFVSRERHGADAEAFAAQVRIQLAGGVDAATLGDPFARGGDFVRRSEAELAAVFGAPFATQVMTLPVGSWSEPVRSSFGLHVVRIVERDPGHAPSVAEERAALRRDWQEQRRAEVNRAALDELRQRYEVRIDQPLEAVARR